MIIGVPVGSGMEISLPQVIVTNFENNIITFEPSFGFDASILEDDMVVSFTITYSQTYVSRSGYGARCKVEVISRSELLRARGYKVDKFDIPLE